jgi:ThiF family
LVTDYSRVLRLAEEVTGGEPSELERHLSAQTVSVFVDAELPGALDAARRFVSTRARMPGRVFVDPEGLRATDRDDLMNIARTVRRDAIADEHDSFVAEVRFALTVTPGAIRAVPDGHGAQVASNESVSLEQQRSPNALGAAFAAALAATEVFKVALEVPETRAARHPYLSFCPVALSSDLTLAPELPHSLEIDVALIGLGAVGSATASVLGQLPLSGRVLLVDRERFAPENLATYSLGCEEDAANRCWKVDLAARAMAGFDVTRMTEPAESLPRRIDGGEIEWPSIVLSGLDSVEARHATQRLWPDLLIDSATGDTMVGLHVAEPDRPCLICFFPPRTDGPSAAERLAEATGLSVGRAARGDNPLTEEDLDGLSENQRAILVQHLGKPVCGLADALGLTTMEANDYRPAIPFASQQAAYLGVGRLLAHLLDFRRDDNFIQYDVLRGPARATIEPRPGDAACYCNERQDTIGQVRDLRRELRKR